MYFTAPTAEPVLWVLIHRGVLNMTKKLLRVLSYVLVAALASVGTLAMSSGMGAAAPQDSYTKLEELSDLIQDRFIGDEDVTKMEDAAAAAMVDSLGDEWSYYMSAQDFLTYKDQMANSYVGVGITIQVREDGYLDIISVEEKGPAKAAGIQAGDILIKAEGQDCAELGIDGTGNVVRGEEGTDVTLTILRDGQEMEFTMTRAYFEVTVAWGQMLEDGIGMVTIENFDGRCRDETIAAIESLLEQGATALIFDVRNNPGGYKDELVKILDYLLPEGVLFRSEYYDGTTLEDKSDKNCLQIPMAVLVNINSYSAAEFFAAALSEYEAAIVVGSQTYGKGYFQQTYELNDGSAVGLSVGKYYTPKGVSLAGVGITPDVVVDVDEELFAQIYYGKVQWQDDPQVQAAIEALKSH